MYGFENVHPASADHLTQLRLMRAMIRLWRVVVVHSHLGEDNQIVGSSMVVGIRIFSIVRGLRLAGDPCRGFGRWQLVGRGLRRLHRPRKLVAG